MASAVVGLVLAGCAPRNDGPTVPKAVGPIIAEQGPPALLEIPHPERRCWDLQFSPDGLMLAVVPAQSNDLKHDHYPRIHRVSDGALLRTLPGGALRCAWNWDGSLLAVARDNWPDIEIWDVPAWTLNRRLTLFDASRAKPLVSFGEKPRPKSDEPYGLTCGSLCFDRHGNLYVVEWSEYKEERPTAFPYEIPRGAVFWNAAGRWTQVDHADFAISAASMGETTRLASVDDGAAIQRVEKNKSGASEVRLEYWIPQVGSASICLSSDGKYLLASGERSVALYELLDVGAKCIQSREQPGEMLPFWRCGFSRDGRFAAYRAGERVTVVRIPSLQTALKIDASASFDLSPDGRLLATEEYNRFATRLYRIPVEGKDGRGGP